MLSQKVSFNYDVSNLEEEYIQLKRRMYKNFFLYAMTLFFFIGIEEVVRSVFLEKQFFPLEGVLHIVGGLLLISFITSLKKNQEIIITLFWMINYLFVNISHYYGDSGFFEKSEDAFYVGVIGSLIEGLVVTRIPKLWMRTVYRIYSLLVRLAVFLPKQKGLLFIQIAVVIFSIAMDFDKEKNDKSLFSFYFNYKEQLVKFKNLVSQDIPEGIVIVSKDLKQCFFANKYFEALLENKKNSNIMAQLNYFVFQDDMEYLNKESISSLQELRTLGSFLESHRRPSIQSPSSNLILKRENPMNENSPRTQKDSIFESKIIDLTWENQPALAIILVDITQQHTILNLKIADSEKDKVLATVSHELRTPLNSILGMVQIMMKKVKDQELFHYLDICHNSGKLLLSLVNSLLDLHQIRANKIKLNSEKINIRQILQDIIQLFEYQCLKKGVLLKLKISPTLPLIITTDKNRLSQVFINLLGNALKFTDEGSIILSAEEAPEKDAVRFSVEDTGIGIKQNDQEKLFQMFGKLEQENKNRNIQGVGLGLAISDNLVRLLNHNSKESGVKLESQVGRGSKFSFSIQKDFYKDFNETSLPFEVSPQMVTVSQRSITDLSDYEYENLSNRMHNYSISGSKINTFQQINSRLSKNYTGLSHSDQRSMEEIKLPNSSSSGFLSYQSPQLAKPTVLIVDDNPLNIMVAEHLVLSHNFQVKTALSGQGAIDIITNYNLSTERIKLILMDCQMPKMDGFQTTKILKKLFIEKNMKEIPIVALTANDSKEDREACKASGMIDCLTKPLKDIELIRTLSRYC